MQWQWCMRRCDDRGSDRNGDLYGDSSAPSDDAYGDNRRGGGRHRHQQSQRDILSRNLQRRLCTGQSTVALTAHPLLVRPLPGGAGIVVEQVTARLSWT